MKGGIVMLRTVRFLSLFLLALVLGVSFSHLLQWGPKATLPVSSFLDIQQVLLSQYGAILGWSEGLAVVTLGVVAYLIRHNKRQLTLTIVALVCVVVMIGIWAVLINPINIVVNTWSEVSVPDRWQTARSMWHLLHGIRLLLSALAFGTFGWAALEGRATDNQEVTY